MNFNCMPFSSAFEAVLQDSNRAVFALNLKVAKVASQVIEACFCSQLLEMK